MFLIACPNCARQYDATGLEPGSQVRCFCEQLFLVKWPEKLTATALVCSHCGGGVSASDQQCPYCEAAISEADRRKTTLCPGCFTRLDDDSHHCRACGIEIRPQALSPLPADRDCPRCQGPLRVRSLEIVDVVECGKCLGMWITPNSFEAVTVQATDRGGDTALFLQKPVPAVKSPPQETVCYIPCLLCGELMQRRQYTWRERHSGVVIDSCRGHGVWLDYEEIERIVDFVSKDGNDPAAPQPLDPRPFIVTSTRPRHTRRSRASGKPLDGHWIASFIANLGASLFGR
jgi:Zn-finger nucleic acid-binding protein